MARARNIKPSIMDNEQLADLPPLTRLLFIFLWMLADREGRLEDRPKRIAAQALPYDRDADSDRMLNDLQAAGFILRYRVGSIAVIQILAFGKHQAPHVREAASTLPRPGQCTTTEVPEHSQGDVEALPRTGQGDVEASPRSPDSLIPDSLIPNTPPLTPPLAEEGREPSAERTRLRADRVTLKTFLTRCRARDEPAISGYQPVHDYATRAGLPMGFVQLAWDVFRDEHGPGGPNAERRQTDWRRHFLNYVRKGYYRLWYAKPDGTFALTTQGIQAQNACGRAA
ncbi:MAG: hypothetical protein QM766_19155 [Burkholderiaceae bacterium]